jgi:hypothetical protein
MFKFANPAGAAVQYLYSVFIAASARKSIRPLLKVDERLLRDIGLTRADVIDCLTNPMNEDPSELLISRRRERAASRVTYIDHPARWRGEDSRSSSIARIERVAA